MGVNTHIIHRVNLEIEVPEMRLANQVKDDAVRLLYNEILPKLEKYMDKLVPVDAHFQFNQLNINLEHLSEENFEKEFTRLILQVFHEKTEKLVEPIQLEKDQVNEDDEEVVKYSKEQMAFESFLFFLETGRLPWWSEKSGELLHEQNLIEILNNSTSEFQVLLVSLLSENTVALERLLNQFSLQFIFSSIFQIIFKSIEVQKGFATEELASRIFGLLKIFADRKKSDGQTLSNPEQIFFREVIRLIFSQEKVFHEQKLLDILNKFSAKPLVSFTLSESEAPLDFEFLLNELRSEITSSDFKDQQVSDFPEIEKLTEKVTENQPKKISKKSKKLEVEEEGIFLDNAGLVLLHPFFDSFFKDFDLLTEGQFKDIESQTLGVHLLHYLATKMELAAEYDLVMEKFICGWDPDLPIAREVALSQNMKDECETLLSAAIRHWSALKNTSPDGLREGFLQREGKLILNDFQNRLVIENKAQDVLLSFLPWGYSIFKLPWMESALYVEWQQTN